ncbi:tunicamycin resistance protein [Chlorogloeopsis sp. ULAP01]|uniref:AAA family ATPase n=1 Tax=Chlorogloeopsis sp. ULAP01 TaxID=3056483 RepID=UPI0025AB2C59|nr:AAA family ATPase [Chlorogloeopsis sp. ULAP01]MDM9384753.1 tunicamycin resistance protein [Chlorogloeopsis sp. ULAP01]
MIIWLNGAFGIGKTQTAFELHSRIPGSFVFDPEQIGFFLRKIVPSEVRVGDFQNHLIWREFTYQGLRYVAENFTGTIIVPMTVVDHLYYDQTVGALRREGLQVHHFTLLASRDTILRRLWRRGDGSNSWNARQLDRCLMSLSDEKFAVHLNTEGKAIEAVAEEIAQYIDVDLKPPTWHPILRPLKRMIVQVRHVRL